MPKREIEVELGARSGTYDSRPTGEDPLRPVVSMTGIGELSLAGPLDERQPATRVLGAERRLKLYNDFNYIRVRSFVLNGAG